MMKKYIAEAIGTFALVFCGTGAIVINEVSGGTVTHVGIAITFGLIVLAMIYTFGEVSVIGAVVLLEARFAGPICGASMNPARSLAPAVVSGNAAQVWIYLTAPVLGALLAVVVGKTVFFESPIVKHPVV